MRLDAQGLRCDLMVPDATRPPHLPSRSALLANLLRPFQEFARTGSLGSVALFACTLIALVWANSPWSDAYFRLWETVVVVGPETVPLAMSLRHWVSDGLMVVFFLLVGLEIKRELLVGELASVRRASLPIAAAIGGMIVPAPIYALINGRGAGEPGWGIPMATDIAFALGVLALVGSRTPVGLKVFLAAFAIVDDMGAVLVIAVFYTSSLSWMALGAAAAIVALLLVLNVMRVGSLVPYLLLGVLLWLTLISSGLHATIAGVILACTIPARTHVDTERFSARARALVDEFDSSGTVAHPVMTSMGQQEAIHQLDVASDDVQGPLLKLEHALHAPVAFVVMPIFALANAGVRIEDVGHLALSPIALGVLTGLVIGKPIGITLFSWLSLRFLGASLPTGVSLRMIHGVSWIGGIGFTMSLFIAGLAFSAGGQLDAAKFGILSGSIVGGTIGFLLLRTQTSPRKSAATRAERLPEEATS